MFSRTLNPPRGFLLVLAAYRPAESLPPTSQGNYPHATSIMNYELTRTHALGRERESLVARTSRRGYMEGGQAPVCTGPASTVIIALSQCLSYPPRAREERDSGGKLNHHMGASVSSVLRSTMGREKKKRIASGRGKSENYAALESFVGAAWVSFFRGS